MDSPQHRDAARQTADDFEWLEAHCRARPDLARHAGELRLAAALMRNVVSPALEKIQPPPLHLAVVGGAGAGKSTITNFLSGSIIAEANPQAGYTRHPTAFIREELVWPQHLGFVGPLRRLEREQPSNLDEDVYQVQRRPAVTPDPMMDFILWDCPDMTTWAATGYVPRLMEVAALADVIVYVASDERYNDEVPTQFLQLLIRGGKAVVVAFTKMNAENAPTMSEHFRREVLEKICEPDVSLAIPIVTIPFLTSAQRSSPAEGQWRMALLNQILVLCPDAAAVRTRTVTNAIRFLETASEGLLEVARKDLAELSAWRATVAAGQASFVTRYRNEYLEGEPFRRFERTRTEIVKLLELPGRGQAISAMLQSLRWPAEWLLKQVAKFVARPDSPNLSERTVLTTAFSAWLDSLQAESLRRAGNHTLWKQLTHAFDAGLKSEAQQKFEESARRFESKETGDLEQSARQVADSLRNDSLRLPFYRGANVGLGLAAVLSVIVIIFARGSSIWNLLWLIPLAAFAAHGVMEIVVRIVVERARGKARQQREVLLATTITSPLAAWLDDRPVSGGSPVERLQAILQRVPLAIRSFSAAVVP